MSINPKLIKEHHTKKIHRRCQGCIHYQDVWKTPKIYQGAYCSLSSKETDPTYCCPNFKPKRTK